MRETIICPNCNKNIEISLVGAIKKDFLIEGFELNKDGTYHSPRGKSEVESDKLQSTIDFLLSNWADKIIVYSLEGEKLREFMK